MRDIEFSPLSIPESDQLNHAKRRVKPAGLPKSDWNKRYTFFSKYDSGIEMDNEAWYETTPENIALYVSLRISRCLGILEGFCGVGGNTIQFARFHNPVIAVDISTERIRMCQNNTRIYEMDHRVAFRRDDVLAVLKSHDPSPGTCFYASPPWGGKSCYNAERMAIDAFPVDMRPIIRSAYAKFGSLVLHFPRNTDIASLSNFLESMGVQYFEIERVFFTEPDRRLKVILVFLDKSITARDSVLSIARDARRHSISSFLGFGFAARLLTTSLVRVNYIGRFIADAFSRDGLKGVSISHIPNVVEALANLA